MIGIEHAIEIKALRCGICTRTIPIRRVDSLPNEPHVPRFEMTERHECPPYVTSGEPN